MGFEEQLSLEAAMKYPNPTQITTLTFIDKSGCIDVPINVECKRNPRYCFNFNLSFIALNINVH